MVLSIFTLAVNPLISHLFPVTLTPNLPKILKVGITIEYINIIKGLQMNDKLIAVVDDEPGIIKTVSEYLSGRGFKVKGFPDAEIFFNFLNKEKPDLIILDLKLPGMHGFEVCRILREKERFSSIPIIILSANREEPDKVSGLEMGADDYLVKPFSLNELTSRINAVLRRGPVVQEKKIDIGDRLSIDLREHEVMVDGERVELTPAEFKILEFLAARKGHVFTRERILDYLWGDEKIVVQRTIDVHIRHLREKLHEAGKYIKNIRSVGYKLEDEI